MGLLTLIAILIVIIVILELFKHHFTKNLLKYVIYGIILVFIILILSAYVDLGSFFDKDNTFSQTGAMIAEDVNEDFEKVDLDKIDTLDTIKEKTKNFIKDELE